MSICRSHWDKPSAGESSHGIPAISLRPLSPVDAKPSTIHFVCCDILPTFTGRNVFELSPQKVVMPGYFVEVELPSCDRFDCSQRGVSEEDTVRGCGGCDIIHLFAKGLFDKLEGQRNGSGSGPSGHGLPHIGTVSETPRLAAFHD